MMDEATIQQQVKSTYAQAATEVMNAADIPSPLATSLYGDIAGTPAAATSLGCANPTALVEIHGGETVLDLGSGGGLDVLMTARRVGPTGHVIGVDMTPEMIQLAHNHQKRSGLPNVEFRQGHLEDLPVGSTQIDVIMSNCVLNLTVNKARVLAEAYRVLKPGGRFAITDLAALQPLPVSLATNLAAWAGCIAGVPLVSEWAQWLDTAGFIDAKVIVVRRFGRDDLDLLKSDAMGLKTLGDLTEADLAAAEGQLVSVQVTATKPMGLPE